jgi:hypothetical protein
MMEAGMPNNNNKRQEPSDRSFGWLFVAVSTAVAAYLFYQGWRSAPIAAAVAGILLAVTLLAPRWLRPLKRAWLTLGLFLGKIVSPIVLGVLFFGLFTPLGLMMRLFGRDALRLRRQPLGLSHWVRREPPGPTPESLREQG